MCRLHNVDYCAGRFWKVQKHMADFVPEKDSQEWNTREASLIAKDGWDSMEPGMHPCSFMRN